jgi:hypothetical protein
MLAKSWAITRYAVERLEILTPMRSASKAWSPRLLAATVALALVVACVIGAYAHASGHQPPPAGHAVAVLAATMADALSGADGHGGEHAAAAPVFAADCDHAHGPADCRHDADHPGHSLDCCDTVCNGGQAILAAAPVVPAALPAAPSMEPAAALRGADPGGLDRPPKPFRSV